MTDREKLVKKVEEAKKVCMTTDQNWIEGGQSWVKADQARVKADQALSEAQKKLKEFDNGREGKANQNTGRGEPSTV